MMLEAQEKFEHWLDYAQYDLDSAESVFSSGRWFYVAFMCQQAIEKLIKGLYVLYIDDNVPRIHNIRPVLKQFTHLMPEAVSDDLYKFMDKLSAHYLINRYPDYLNNVSGQICESDATEILRRTKEVFAWLLTMRK